VLVLVQLLVFVALSSCSAPLVWSCACYCQSPLSLRARVGVAGSPFPLSFAVPPRACGRARGARSCHPCMPVLVSRTHRSRCRSRSFPVLVVGLAVPIPVILACPCWCHGLTVPVVVRSPSLCLWWGSWCPFLSSLHGRW
jgi:hypothetical protein